MEFWNMLWAFLNSPLGIAIIAFVLALVVSSRYVRPYWQKFEGTIVAAVRWAEKTIPDNAQNKSVARLDEALRYVLTVHDAMKKRTATAKQIANLKEGIQIVHGRT